MRYYLVTIILIFLIARLENDELSSDVYALFSSYENTFVTSSVCVHELINLLQIGKLERNKYLTETEVLQWLKMNDIKVMYTTEKHLQTLSQLSLYGDHKDPFDRLIIAQAISDKIPLISSDHKFPQYEKEGLSFIFNKR